jgi:outer membrane protein OmpA-like peptidoglycan-associated protein
MKRLNVFFAALLLAAQAHGQDGTRGDRSGGYRGQTTAPQRTDGGTRPQSSPPMHSGDRGTRYQGPRDGGPRYQGHGGQGPRHYGHGYNGPRHYGHGYVGPRYSWARPSWSRGYSRGPYYWSGYPGWAYAAPPLFYSYPAWDPPVYVERIIETEPVYVEREVYVQREPEYVERPPEPVERPPQLQPPATYRERAPYAQSAPQPRIERTTLSATELFEFDKATLRMPQPKLDQIAAAMLQHAEIEKVAINGYTDRLGSDEYNAKLSQQRADAVKAYLVKQGVAAHRLVATGKGEGNPVVQCNDKDRAALIKCLEPNRRVEVEQITIERRVPQTQKGTT